MSVDRDCEQAKTLARRKRRRWLLAIAAVVSVFAMPAAGLWWLSRDRLKAEVIAIGGRYRCVEETGMAVAFRWATRWEHPHVMHRIDIGHSRADDAWLQSHANDLRQSNQLVLFLRESRVTAQGLAVLNDVQNLQFLDLSGTPLDNSAVDTLAGFPTLVNLWIAHTGISDSALAGLARAPHLVLLVIDARQATDAGLAGLRTCPHLQHLRIVDADNECVARLVGFEDLTALDLQGERIDADSLPVLKQMQSLHSLTLIDTQFSDGEVSELRQALTGCRIYQQKSSEIEAQREAGWSVSP